MNKMSVDLNFLLDKEKVEEFINQISQDLFGSPDHIEITEISRTATYNKSSFNVLYKIKVDGNKKEIRVSASQQISKKANFQLLKFIYENGFDSGEFLIAKPLGYFEDFNLMFYENIQGKPLISELATSLSELVLKVKLCAQMLKKIHGLPKPEISLWDANNFFEFKELERGALQNYYPKIATKLDDILVNIKKKIDSDKTTVFCHGDFQPSNLIINQDEIYVLDFDLVSLLDKEYDIANFISQLRIMTKRFGNFENFKTLEKEFLFNYGQYDLEKYNYYEALVDIRILATFCVSQGRENNLEYMPFVFELLKENLNQIGIEFD